MLYVYLLGYPLAVSWSPVIQQAAFSHCNIAARYMLYPVHPDELAGAVSLLRGEDVLGANVTTPHKQSVIPYLDGLDPVASALGAVNTIVHRDNKLIGYNTDVEGARATLKTLSPRGKQVLIIGAGGASRSVLAALSDPELLPEHVTVINRSWDRLESINSFLSDQSFGYSLSLISSPEVEKTAATCDLLINCTSDGEAWTQWKLRGKVWDLNYGIKALSLSEYCRQNNLGYTDGKHMLVTQGQAAFAVWTGKTVPLPIMADALDRALGEQTHEEA